METQPAQIYFVSPKGYALVMLFGSGEFAFVPQRVMSSLTDRSSEYVEVVTTDGRFSGSKGPVVTKIMPASDPGRPVISLPA